MTIAVAHQISPTTQLALAEAIRQADFRGTDLAVLHVAESFDQDDVDHFKAGINDEIEKAIHDSGLHHVPWKLYLTAAPEVAPALLDLLDDIDAQMLVIGARRRSPVGKALVGSVSQTLILDADLPVLVVKADG